MQTKITIQLYIFMLSSLLFVKADVIDIVAQNFKSVGNITTIEGNVRVKKGSDTLNANKVIVTTDSKRNPLNYEAIGEVRFTIITTDKRELKGKGNRLFYDVKKDEYKLYDNAIVQETGKPNILKGDEIVLSGDGSYANVVGKNHTKPARVIFSLEKEEK